jgi:hypothetical protein
MLQQMELQEMSQLVEMVEQILVVGAAVQVTMALVALAVQALLFFVGHKINIKRLHSCQ